VAKTVQTLGALEDYKSAGEFKKAMTEEYDLVKNLFKRQPLLRSREGAKKRVLCRGRGGVLDKFYSGTSSR